MVLIGFIGKPNAGKSTLLNALTDANAQTASYPFTTIEPNKAVGFVSVPCPHVELGLKACGARNSKCVGGTRFVPVNIVDVAGLVEGAHEGRGMGNEFLNDLSVADVLVIVADASGATDAEGAPVSVVGSYDVCRDVSMILGEVDSWIASVLKKNALKAKGRSFKEYALLLTGIKISEDDLRRSVLALGLKEDAYASWSKEEFELLSSEVRKKTRPVVIAANKIDSPYAFENVEKLKKTFADLKVIPIAADCELALKRAREKGWVEYDGKIFKVSPSVSDERVKAALTRMQMIFEKWGGTGVQGLLNEAVFGLLGMVVVFPVEDENSFSNHFGHVLPDAILLPKASTPVVLAGKIHTDLANHFLYAVDAKKRMRIAKEHVVATGDVIKIVSTK